MNSVQGTVILPNLEEEIQNKSMFLDSLQKIYSNVEDCELYEERTGMSIREAKLELKVRGLNDPAKKFRYADTSKSNNTQTEVNGNKNQEISLKKIHDQKSSTMEISYNNDNITVDNRFTSLPEIDTSIDIEKDEEELKSQECNKMDNTTRKRQLDKTPPNSTNQRCKKINNPPISPKAKVQEQNTKPNIPLSPIVTIIPLGAESQNSDEMESQNLDNYDESKEIHPPPITGTTRKTEKEQQTKEHEDTCGCSKCFVAMNTKLVHLAALSHQQHVNRRALIFPGYRKGGQPRRPGPSEVIREQIAEKRKYEDEQRRQEEEREERRRQQEAEQRREEEEREERRRQQEAEQRREEEEREERRRQRESEEEESRRQHELDLKDRELELFMFHFVAC
ncbi:putative uncharacterized protein DDB_G0271982 [Macrobrachium rosenbergii]|uniref:putative uncharacterized protein DDB_G0271982 n=1 Tax=Macrobrachium rosenbergii TaxID=79674 RepID=UPI0034D4B173